MKKFFSLLVIILLASSSFVFVEGETTEPVADSVVGEPAPNEPSAPSEPVVKEPVAGTENPPIDMQTSTEQQTQEQIIKEPVQEPFQPQQQFEESEVSKGIREGKCYVGENEVPCPTSRNACPPINEQDKLKCTQSGGNYNIINSGGCTRFECRFNEKQEQGFFNQCPLREEIDSQIKKCETNGLRALIKNVNGCGFVQCESQNQEQIFEQEGCRTLRDVSGPEREKCESRGDFRLIEIYNEGNQCPAIVCAPAGRARQVQCQQESGEFIANEEGERCVKRSNINEISYEPIEKVPDVAQILKIVINLDKLSLELDSLAAEIDDLAVYFGERDAATGERYRKAALMIKSGKNKITETKERLRVNVRNLQPEDLEDVRKDLRILKESIFEEALYILLSGDVSSEAIAVEEQVYEGNDCKNDGGCFTSKLRTCEEGTILNPEKDTTLSIIGLEDEKCVLEAKLKTPEGEFEMTCKYPNYAFGLSGPEELIPYCEGSLVELIKEKIRNGELGQSRAERMVQIERASTERAFGQNPETLTRNERGDVCQTKEQVENLQLDCKKRGQDAIVEDRNGCPWVICISRNYNTRETSNYVNYNENVQQEIKREVQAPIETTQISENLERVPYETIKEQNVAENIVNTGQEITAQVIKFLRGGE